MNNLSPKYIIDIGACVGLFIDNCLEKYPVEKIYAFEPLSANVDFLQNKYKDDSRIKIIPMAVSNFNGKATLYKKGYKSEKGGMFSRKRYDFPGNAGSSLNSEKGNVSKYVTQKVDVIRFSDFFSTLPHEHIDLLKIDSEGTEYDILDDILETKLYENIGTIYYEDHVRKIPSLAVDRDRIMIRIEELNISNKFYLQQDHLTYIPLLSFPLNV